MDGYCRLDDASLFKLCSCVVFRIFWDKEIQEINLELEK